MSSTERKFCPNFELVNMFRQIPCCFAGASFLVQGLLMWSFSEFGRKEHAHEAYYFWIIPRDGPILSQILIWCLVPLENLTVCFDPNIPGFTWNRLSRIRILRYTTQLYRLLQYRNWSFAPPFFDLLLGFPSASTCRKWHLLPYTHPFSDL